VLEKCAKISLKSFKVHREKHMQNTMENEINVLDLMKYINVWV
jgi:hypothetical protein